MNKFAIISLILITISADAFTWKSKKSIELSTTQIGIDGGQPETIKCRHPKKTILGKLELKKTELELSCYEDYMGGFFHKDLLLAQQDGDAGEAWEVQSLIFFDKKSASIILAIKRYSTYDTAFDCENITKSDSEKYEAKSKECLDKKVKCKMREELLIWDPKIKSFKPSEFKGKVPKRQLKPYDDYIKSCPQTK